MGAIKRETKRRLLSMIHNVQAKVDQVRVNALLDRYDASVYENQKPEQVKSVLFIITRLVRFSGGQTSILRLGTELHKLGYEVGYAVYKPQSKEEMQICASSNLSGFKGDLYTMEELNAMYQCNSFDVVVASSWDTLSFAKKLGKYTMYFVQDYEPYFYPFGEVFLLAKKTYEQGAHMVSLGNWNAEMIKKECHPVSPIDVVDFPYEKKEYPKKERDYMAYQGKKHFVIAVYLKYYGKRLPCILQYMMTNVIKQFEKNGITLEVKYFGEAKNFTVKGGKNQGMLSKKELLALYEEADFGIVASMSNISLIPYEMLATGLPLVEFEDGTFEYFFPKDSAIMTSIDPNDLYQKLKAAMEDPAIIIRQQEKAAEYMKDLSWKKTGFQFHEVLERLCENS